MNEESINIPKPQTVEEMRAEELRKYWLDPSREYPEPHFFYEYNGVGFSPIGGIQAISGQKKNGKTFVLAQLMAAALGSGNERVVQYLGTLQTRADTISWLGHEPKVLYCDTEMEQLNTAKVLRRVHWLCGWDMKIPSDRFAVLWLREVPKSETQSSNLERWRLIKNAIEQITPDIVFIDGLRDLVNDFNDNKESSAIVGEMMSIASQRNICIWNVLHMNPRPSNDDESKMRGHLGTELGNKVSDTFVSIKKKDAGTGQVTFTVKQLDARGKDVDDWKFEIVDDVGGLGIPKLISSGSTTTQKKEVQCDSAEDILKWINDGKERYNWPMDRKSIKELVFKEIGGVKKGERQQADLIAAIDLGYFVETTTKKNGYPMLQPPDDLPF